MRSRIGRRNPLYSTAIGKVMLADKEQTFTRKTLSQIKFIKQTDRTLENTDQFLSVLSIVKEQHYAESNQNKKLGCFAEPFYDRFGIVIAGTSISLPTLSFEKQRMPYNVGLLHQVD
jgi:IclR family KDG regulon transcriptional repressor